MRNKLLYSLIGAMLILPGIVQAETISYSAAIDLKGTNWSELIFLPKFDTNWGTLNSIIFDLEGSVFGDAQFQHRGNQAATIEMDLKAEIILKRLDGSEIVITMPAINTIEIVASFDEADYPEGVYFTEPSGRTYTNIEESKSVSKHFTAPHDDDDLILFSAPGASLTDATPIELIISANALSTAWGSGRMESNFNTFASARATVTYDYTAAAIPGSEIPEPGTMLLLGTGLIGLLGYSRRRKTA